VEGGSRRAVIAAFLANLGIAISKLLGFLATGAASLLAEAIHSVADTGNQALLLLGGRRARRAPTPEHPFGYGSERYFWAFVVALVLFALGSIFAIAEGVEKLRNPHMLESPLVAYVILGIAILLEAFSLRTAIREAAKVRGEWSWWQFIRRATVPELPVVLLEDLGALLGLGTAVVGVTLTEITGNARWDALGSMGIGVLLGFIAIVLATEMKSLLIGESASSLLEDRIRAALTDGPEVRRIIHLRTLHLGPDELLVGAKLDFAAETVPEVARAIDTVEARVRNAVPIARVIYIEPDLYRSDGSATAREAE
jgi:cation diffusion facilitator family transporter